MAVRLKIRVYWVCYVITIIFTLMAVGVELVEGWKSYGYDFKAVVQISPSENATLLIANDVRYVNDGKENFHMYCFVNVPKSVLQIWRNVQLVLLQKPRNYDIYQGFNEDEVKTNYESKSIWDTTLFYGSGSETVIEFPAFSQYCVGISTTHEYSFYLQVRTINYWKALQTLCGTFFFLASPSLSRNPFFHYAAGISLGITASFLILLYFISRFIPKRSASFAVILFGSSFVLYFIKVVWSHLHDIVTQYMDYVFVYCIIAAFLSFVVCYRIGPIKNERTLNLIQWCMQALSLLTIFFSSEYREVSTALIIVLISIQIIPIQWIKWAKCLWYRCFPPRVKLLTELEYIEQGHIETRKALESLRQYCSSPDCNVWKVVRNLKDPVRFANFIENGSHYSDEELLAYNSEDFDESFNYSEMTEDFDSDI